MEWNDWDKFFARCAINSDYLGSMITALNAQDDEAVRQLLNNIDASGGSATVLTERVDALKQALGPMTAVSTAFGANRLAP